MERKLLDTRQRLLDQALLLFSARGYEGVGVQELVESAGVTKPPLYHHFGSKVGLLTALLELHFAPFLDQLEAAASYRDTLPTTLASAAEALVRFAQEHPEFHRLHLALWFSAADSEAHRTVAPFLEKRQRIFSDLFSRALVDHGNLRGRQDLLAATFLGMVDTYAGFPDSPEGAGRADLVRLLVKHFMYGIYSL